MPTGSPIPESRRNVPKIKAFRDWIVNEIKAPGARRGKRCDFRLTLPDPATINRHGARRGLFAPLIFCLDGGVGEWLNPADCKSARLAYTGSNPVPSTSLRSKGATAWQARRTH